MFKDSQKINALESQIKNLTADKEIEIKQIEANYKLKSAQSEAEHVLKMKEKEFEIKHNKDVEILTAKKKVTDLERELATSQKENEMLRELVKLNSDIIDVKNLVSELIKKLPTISIDGMLGTKASDNKGK